MHPSAYADNTQPHALYMHTTLLVSEMKQFYYQMQLYVKDTESLLYLMKNNDLYLETS